LTLLSTIEHILGSSAPYVCWNIPYLVLFTWLAINMTHELLAWKNIIWDSFKCSKFPKIDIECIMFHHQFQPSVCARESGTGIRGNSKNFSRSIFSKVLNFFYFQFW
jgi:hypothetical protein